VAVKEYEPLAVSVIEQLPVEALVPVVRLALQICVPSVTLTVPVGTPAPGLTVATSTSTVMGWPTTGFEGEVEVIVVVVDAAPTLTGVEEVVAELS
jgi:hypothetical protein